MGMLLCLGARRALNLTLAAATAALLAACGGGGGGGGTPQAMSPHPSIDGVATKGIVRNGLVTIAERRGGAWQPVGEAATNADGHFHASLDGTYEGGVLRVTVSDHPTLDSATVCDRRAGCGAVPFGGDLPLGGLTLTALHPGGLAPTSSVSLQVTPLTHAAARAAEHLAETQPVAIDAGLVNALNQAVGDMVGGIDLLGTTPDATSTAPDARKYAFLVAALASMAFSDGIYAATAEPVRTAVDRLADTVSTGSVPVDDPDPADAAATVSLNDLFAAAIAEATAAGDATAAAALGDDRERVSAGRTAVSLLVDSDGDGVPDFRDRCAATPAAAAIAPDGCPLFSIGGVVTGLSGALVLQNNGVDDLTLTASGPFTFPARVASGGAYAVTVLAHPPSQLCAVGGATGTVGGFDVTGVRVACADVPPGSFTLGGTVTDLSGTLVLQYNGGNDLALTTNGPFVFGVPVADGGAYTVTILAQPPTQTCGVTGGVGTIAGANVAAVSVACADKPPSATPDEDAFQAALSLFNAGDYGGAVSAFDAFLATWSTPGSARLGDAQYYLGRSIHEQARAWLAAAPHPAAANVAVTRLSDARAAYARVAFVDPAGSLVDDAAYQSAATYFDAGDYATSLSELNAFLDAYRTLGSNRIDNAQYLAARSIHEQAASLLAVATAPADIQAALLRFEDARTAYAQFALDNPGSSLLDNAAYLSALTHYDAGDFATAITGLTAFMTGHPLSTLLDDAQYYVGRTLRAQAGTWLSQAATQADVDAALLRFADARAAFAQVAAVDPLSPLVDNAALHIELTYYDEGDFATAIAGLSAFAAAHPLSTLVDDARYYVGRSVHGQAKAMLDVARAPAEIDAAMLRFADARAAYAQVAVADASSSLLDNAAYLTALTDYDAGNFAAAISALAAFETDFGPTLSTLLDDARYYAARSVHREAAVLLAQAVTQADVDAALLRFADARVAYARVAALDPASPRVDAAAYRTAFTYFDAGDYATAITELTAFLATYEPLGSSLADNARYFIGRSTHEEAVGLLASGQAAAAALRFADARVEYNVVICDVGEVGCPYPGSTLEDDARYQVGRTYYDEALYAQAIPEFQAVLGLYPLGSARDEARYYLGRAQQRSGDPAAAEATFRQLLLESPASIYADNAQYHLAMTFHDRQDCASELPAMQAVATAYPWSSYVGLAQPHIDDLLLVPPVTHTCL